MNLRVTSVVKLTAKLVGMAFGMAIALFLFSSVAFGHSYTAQHASTTTISNVANGGGFGHNRCFHGCHFNQCFHGCHFGHNQCFRGCGPRTTSFFHNSTFNLKLKVSASNTTAFNSTRTPFSGCGGCFGGGFGGSNVSFFNSNTFNLSLNVSASNTTAFNSTRF